jgi:hypothetical protein
MRTGRLAALVAVLTSLLALGSVSAASVSAASATAASATPTRPATTRPGAGLFSVSCPAVSFCLAVGSHSGPAGRRHPLVEEWNGKSWRVLANPPGLALERVSCTSATFCAATGGPLGVGPADRSEFLTWNGHGWRPHPLPYGATSEISCGSRRYCVAIRYNTRIEAWHGVRWHPVPGTSPCNLGAANGCLLLDVSCANATVCMAIGSSPAAGNATESWAELYNGRRWTSSVPPDTPLDFVACSGQGLCMATGNGADGYTPPPAGPRTRPARPAAATATSPSHRSAAPD